MKQSHSICIIFFEIHLGKKEISGIRNKSRYVRALFHCLAHYKLSNYFQSASGKPTTSYLDGKFSNTQNVCIGANSIILSH